MDEDNGNKISTAFVLLKSSPEKLPLLEEVMVEFLINQAITCPKGAINLLKMCLDTNLSREDKDFIKKVIDRVKSSLDKEVAKLKGSTVAVQYVIKGKVGAFTKAVDEELFPQLI